jgi:hypothetical protein
LIRDSRAPTAQPSRASADPTTFDEVVVTEKINGTNVRLILVPGAPGWLIGSRSELLTARGDLVANPALGIVSEVRDTAEALLPLAEAGRVTVVYGEVFGGKVTAASAQYTSTRAVGFRVFDVGSFDVERLDSPRADISAWRDRGGQDFLTTSELDAAAVTYGLPLVPRVTAQAPPTDVRATSAWLNNVLGRSQAVLDEAALGHAEGVVVRSPDRSQIAKIRVEDYRRTLR